MAPRALASINSAFVRALLPSFSPSLNTEIAQRERESTPLKDECACVRTCVRARSYSTDISVTVNATRFASTTLQHKRRYSLINVNMSLLIMGRLHDD